MRANDSKKMISAALLLIFACLWRFSRRATLGSDSGMSFDLVMGHEGGEYRALESSSGNPRSSFPSLLIKPLSMEGTGRALPLMGISRSAPPSNHLAATIAPDYRVDNFPLEAIEECHFQVFFGAGIVVRHYRPSA